MVLEGAIGVWVALIAIRFVAAAISTRGYQWAAIAERCVVKPARVILGAPGAAKRSLQDRLWPRQLEMEYRGAMYRYLPLRHRLRAFIAHPDRAVRLMRWALARKTMREGQVWVSAITNRAYFVMSSRADEVAVSAYSLEVVSRVHDGLTDPMSSYPAFHKVTKAQTITWAPAPAPVAAVVRTIYRMHQV